jgi:hypothetical protein
MKDRPKGSPLTRRRFVTMVAAGSAALIAAPAYAATATRPARGHAGATAATMTEPERKEFERQRRATLDTLAVLRKHAMGPGTEMASVFRPLKSTRRSG